MRILIAGAGATGGYFGAGLAQAGRDVTFLVRPGRAESLRRDGLRIVTPNGDLTLAPKLVTTDQITAPYDAVILAVKAFALEQALADLAPAIGPGSMIVPFLNGMRHVGRLVERFGETPVLGGVCVVATTLDTAGRIVQLADMAALTYGERDGAPLERTNALHAALSGAGFDTRLSASIMQDMWEKWVTLATAGALTCLLDGNVGEIETVPEGAALASRFVDESIAVATASGFPPTEAFTARVRGMLTATGSGFAPSMYRDLRAGRPVEVEHILGDMLARARTHGLSTPFLEAAVARLRVYQNRITPAGP